MAQKKEGELDAQIARLNAMRQLVDRRLVPLFEGMMIIAASASVANATSEHWTNDAGRCVAHGPPACSRCQH
jgi:hypothetical protein